MYRNKVILSVLTVFAILSLSTIPIFADTNPNLPIIRIVVLSPSGSPIQGANVYVSFEDNVNVEYQLAHTNAQGRVSFNIANNTMYEFVINGTGYQTITGHWNFTWIANGQTINEYVSSNACHTKYTLKATGYNDSIITMYQTVC